MRVSIIQFKILSLFVLHLAIQTAQAQKNQPVLLTVGDPAPPLQVGKWLKGSPVQTFKKGEIYVVELWATWCAPCIKSMPHLSALARNYKDEVTIIGVDVLETENTSLADVNAFVDSMGARMDYRIVTDDNNAVVTNWLTAESTEDQHYGIPRAYVVNKEGKLAWSGLPKDLDTVLQKVVDGTWKLASETEKQGEERRVRMLELALNDTLNAYSGDARLNSNDLGKPDSILFKINQALEREPKLIYSPFIIFHTFSALLQVNPDIAFAYGKSILNNTSIADPQYLNLALAIEYNSNQLHFPAKIYRLGAELEQARITSYHQDINVPNAYHKMANFYYDAKDKHKAKRSGRKAIRTLKRQKNFSRTDMTLYKSELQQYRKYN